MIMVLFIDIDITLILMMLICQRGEMEIIQSKLNGFVKMEFNPSEMKSVRIWRLNP